LVLRHHHALLRAVGHLLLRRPRDSIHLAGHHLHLRLAWHPLLVLLAHGSHSLSVLLLELRELHAVVCFW
jgi:hypothetical protein